MNAIRRLPQAKQTPSPKPNSPRLRWLPAVFLLLASLTAYATQVELTTTVEGDLQPTIKGVCNLPSGDEARCSGNAQGKRIRVRCSGRGASWSIRSRPATARKRQSNAGRYHLEIMSVHPNDQADPVKALIGRKGQELRGPLTRRYSGFTWVRLFTTLELGRGANAELDQARREQVRLSETRWWRKNCSDICTGGEHYAEQSGQGFDRPACFKTCVSGPPRVSR